MNDIRIDPQWIVIGVALLMLGVGVYAAYGAYLRRSRRKGLLARLERVGFEAAHQVLVPDGMGGYIHIDHILLTPRGVLVLDTRPVNGSWRPRDERTAANVLDFGLVSFDYDGFSIDPTRATTVMRAASGEMVQVNRRHDVEARYLASLYELGFRQTLLVADLGLVASGHVAAALAPWLRV